MSVGCDASINVMELLPGLVKTALFVSDGEDCCLNFYPAFSGMEWNSKTPLWDWDNAVVLSGKVGDIPKQIQPTDWAIEGDGGIDCTSGYSSGGGGGGRCGSELEDLGKKKHSAQVEDTGASPDLVASVCPGEPLIGLKLGKRTYFEDVCVGNSTKNSSVSVTPPPATNSVKKTKASCQSTQSPYCQVEGCSADLFAAKDYHRRHRVCEIHSKCPKVVVAGLERRFCQQCSRFHDLSEFDEKKRSCRRRLSDHNARRRRPQPDTISFNSARLSSSLYGLEASVVASNLDATPDVRRALSLLSTNNWALADSEHVSLDQLMQTSSAQPAMHAGHQGLLPASSDVWQAEQPTAESHVPSLALHGSSNQFQQFQLFKAPYESAYFSNHNVS